MIDEKSKTNRFVGLFLLGNFLFSYPVMTLFNTSIDYLGIPRFFFFMFSAWLLLIGFRATPLSTTHSSEITSSRSNSCDSSLTALCAEWTEERPPCVV